MDTQIAADFVGLSASMLVATDRPSAMAAKAATATIPIVFTSGRFGLVSSSASTARAAILRDAVNRGMSHAKVAGFLGRTEAEGREKEPSLKLGRA